MKTPDTTKAVSSAPIKRDFNSKFIATAAQYKRLLQMLRLRPHNTMELRRAGVMMPAARVKELNDRHGYQIPTVERVDLWDEWGFKHARIAIYELQAEPETDGAA